MKRNDVTFSSTITSDKLFNGNLLSLFKINFWNRRVFYWYHLNLWNMIFPKKMMRTLIDQEILMMRLNLQKLKDLHLSKTLYFFEPSCNLACNMAFLTQISHSKFLSDTFQEVIYFSSQLQSFLLSF